MASQKKKDWAVFFLIKAAGGSIRNVIIMTKEIRSIELKNDVPIILCIHFYRENLSALLNGDETAIPTNPASQTPTTIFFTVSPDHANNPRLPNKLVVLDEQTDFDITNPRWLKEYFREKIILRYKAEHYLLLTWDHGRWFGVFDGPDKRLLQAKDLSGRVAFRDQDVPILTMEELSDAIRWAFGKKKIDVVIMMNCYMQYIDAGYALRDSVKYLVAPETYMYFDGYNYALIFRVLLGAKVSPKELARHAVTSFPTKIYSTHKEGLIRKRETAIFVTDLQYYSLFASLLDKLVDYLLSKINEVKVLVDKAKAVSQIYPTNDIYDFYAFLSYLESCDLFKDDPLPASLIFSIRELMILEKFIGDSFEVKSNDLINSPSGFSIHIPLALPGRIPNPEFDNFFKTAFSKETKWIKFITELIKP